MLSENLCDPAESLFKPDVFQRDNNAIKDQKLKIGLYYYQYFLFWTIDLIKKV